MFVALIVLLYFITPIAFIYLTLAINPVFSLLVPMNFAFWVIAQNYGWISHRVFAYIEGSECSDSKGGLSAFVINVLLCIITTLMAAVVCILF